MTNALLMATLVLAETAPDDCAAIKASIEREWENVQSFRALHQPDASRVDTLQAALDKLTPSGACTYLRLRLEEVATELQVARGEAAQIPWQGAPGEERTPGKASAPAAGAQRVQGAGKKARKKAAAAGDPKAHGETPSPRVSAVNPSQKRESLTGALRAVDQRSPSPPNMTEATAPSVDAYLTGFERRLDEELGTGGTLEKWPASRLESFFVVLSRYIGLLSLEKVAQNHHQAAAALFSRAAGMLAPDAAGACVSCSAPLLARAARLVAMFPDLPGEASAEISSHDTDLATLPPALQAVLTSQSNEKRMALLSAYLEAHDAEAKKQEELAAAGAIVDRTVARRSLETVATSLGFDIALETVLPATAGGCSGEEIAKLFRAELGAAKPRKARILVKGESAPWRPSDVEIRLATNTDPAAPCASDPGVACLQARVGVLCSSPPAPDGTRRGCRSGVVGNEPFACADAMDSRRLRRAIASIVAGVSRTIRVEYGLSQSFVGAARVVHPAAVTAQETFRNTTALADPAKVRGIVLPESDPPGFAGLATTLRRAIEEYGLVLGPIGAQEGLRVGWKSEASGELDIEVSAPGSDRLLAFNYVLHRGALEIARDGCDGRDQADDGVCYTLAVAIRRELINLANEKGLLGKPDDNREHDAKPREKRSGTWALASFASAGLPLMLDAPDREHRWRLGAGLALSAADTLALGASVTFLYLSKQARDEYVTGSRDSLELADKRLGYAVTFLLTDVVVKLIGLGAGLGWLGSAS